MLIESEVRSETAAKYSELRIRDTSQLYDSSAVYEFEIPALDSRRNGQEFQIHRTSAADLKFLHHLPRVRARNFRSKSGTRIIELLVPFSFSKFVSEVAALYHELRKEGTNFAGG